MGEIERLQGLGWIRPGSQPLPDSHERIQGELAEEDGQYPDSGFDVLLAGDVTGYWFDHRARCIGNAMKASGIRVLWDIGAGLGANAKRLEGMGYDIYCVEPHQGAVNAMQSNGLTAFSGTLEEMDFPNSSISALGLFDVIEHLSHPNVLLREAFRVLEPGGRLLITVPALPVLWSEEDEYAGHKVRYTKRSLNTLASDCGFSRPTNEYLFGALALAAIVSRTIPYRLGLRRSEKTLREQMRKQLNPPKAIDTALRRTLNLETALARYLSLPVGSSIFSVWIKEE